jgi:hypothetical protein
MTLIPTIAMCAGLFVGNFIGGLITYKSWRDALAQGLIVIPIYLLFALVATKCGVELP